MALEPRTRLIILKLLLHSCMTLGDLTFLRLSLIIYKVRVLMIIISDVSHNDNSITGLLG